MYTVKNLLQTMKRHIMLSALFVTGLSAIIAGTATASVVQSAATVSAVTTAKPFYAHSGPGWSFSTIAPGKKGKMPFSVSINSGMKGNSGTKGRDGNGGCTYVNHLITCTVGGGNPPRSFNPGPVHFPTPPMGFNPGPVHFPTPPLPSAPTSCQAASSGTVAPTTKAVVSVKMTEYGPVLVVGSGSNENCVLYMLTADNTSASPATYGCSDTPVVANLGSCDQNIWPALLSSGMPIAGRGVNPHLLGIVKRSDVISGKTVDQVTYNGHPLYQFFLDKNSAETNGAGLNDGLAGGIWYLMSPWGIPAAGHATITLEGTTNDGVVLSALMNTGAGYKEYPVYTFSGDKNGKVACTGKCAQFWPPVLTSEFPIATNGVDQRMLGVVRDSDGSMQVTYKGQPLYLFIKDAAASASGEATGNGLGSVFGGEFETINPAAPTTTTSAPTTTMATTTTSAPTTTMATTTTSSATTTTSAPTTTMATTTTSSYYG